jgi:O-methyltransferase involved in polyketide biosynthesis
VTEGLLIYLDPADVAALASDLNAQPAVRWWLADLASPRLLKMMQRSWGKQLASGRAPFRFAPEDSTGFFEPYGWKEAEWRSTWTESERLQRQMPMAWLWRFLARFYSDRRMEEMQRFSGYPLLERA